jgi:hypothetical protein
MPWKASLGDNVIDLRALASSDRVAMHEERPPFLCPGCAGPMTLRAHDASVDLDPARFRYFIDQRGPFVAFAHYPGVAERCKALGFHGDESFAHLGLKQSLCEAAQAKGWWPEVEVYHQLPSGERCRADVVITREDQKTRVLEAQIAPLGPDEAVRRSQVYREAFGNVLWTHTKQRPWSRRLPSLRVDGDDQDTVIGGMYADAGCVELAPPAPLFDVVGMVLPPGNDLTWIWVADDYGGFVRLGGARPPQRRRRPTRRAADTETRIAGSHVRECVTEPATELPTDDSRSGDIRYFAPDGTPWCRFEKGTSCVNGGRCLNLNHRSRRVD